MSPHEFCLWLDGFFMAIYGKDGRGVLCRKDVAAVRNQLKMVRDVELRHIAIDAQINGYNFEIKTAPSYPQDHPPKVYGSALACNHANEMPVKCPCDSDCYCKQHSCIENAYQNVY